MKQFIKYIFGIVAFLLISLFTLDMAYTAVFNNEVIANKVKYLMAVENKHYDAVFLGSSRVDNHIVTEEFSKQGIHVINAGLQGTSLKDNLLILKLLVDNKVTFDRLFIQLDYVYNANDLSITSFAEILPYFRKPIMKDFLKKEFKDFNNYYYIPFYRYAVNDYRIGFRGVFSNLFSDKRVDGVFNDYHPLFGTSEMGAYKLPNKLSENPKAFNAINDFCKNNNIQVVYFTAPFCSKLKPSPFTKLLGERIQNYKDYSMVFKDDSLFSSCGHLNNKGAIEFSNEVITDFFAKVE